MTKFSYNRESNQEYIQEKTFKKAVEKIKQIVNQENFKITSTVIDKLDQVVNDIKTNFGVEISKDEVLKGALEATYLDQGGWLGKLEDIYINFLVAEIENKISAGQEFYVALGAVLTELKRRGIKVDSKQVEKKLKEKM